MSPPIDPSGKTLINVWPNGSHAVETGDYNGEGRSDENEECHFVSHGGSGIRHCWYSCLKSKSINTLT
jgi:hypothetical protein